MVAVFLLAFPCDCCYVMHPIDSIMFSGVDMRLVSCVRPALLFSCAMFTPVIGDLRIQLSR